jgi:hypothetical protein
MLADGRRVLMASTYAAGLKQLTWDDILRIHGVLVLNKAEAIHEFDLGNLPGAMGVEVVLNVGLGS